MFEQTFKNIDDILHKDAGATSELDYTEQTSWILFLKYLDALEQTKAMEAELEGKAYNFIVDAAYRWPTWAAPKTTDGKFDHNNALMGDDLKDFVNLKLFPYLKGFKQRATGPNTIEYKIGEIFGEINNKIQSGYNLREVIERIDELSFNTQAEKHELSHLYEAKIKNMGNAGRNGGEYYTPRPLIRAMIQVTNPKIGETIYDGAVGSAGFLCEAFDYLRNQPNLSTSDLNTLQTSTFYGKEKKSLAYVIAIMNMILHGIEAPNIIHTNTLAENISDIQEKDRFDIILANPPFGGKERAEVQQNFPIKTGETAFLFLQHFIKTLRAGGRAAVVIKNTFLSNTDNASVSLRKLLLESCNLHTVLDCPGGTFQGAGVKTVVLFFEKGAPTRNTWFYQLDPGRNMGKTNPLNDADLAEFVALQKTFADSSKSWSVSTVNINQTTFDLSVKNPNSDEEVLRLSPQDIMSGIAALDAECAEVLAGIKALQSVFTSRGDEWIETTLGEICDVIGGGTPSKANESYFKGDIFWATVRDMKSELLEDTEFKITTDAVKNSSTNIIPKENVVIATRVGLGKVCLLKNDTAINQDLRGIVPKKENLVNAKFLFYWFKSNAQTIINEGTGATVQGVKLPFIKSLIINLPPFSVQTKIAENLIKFTKETQRLETIYQRKIALLDDLKKSLLQQAFAGEL